MANYKYPNSSARKRAVKEQQKKYKRAHMSSFAFRLHNEHDRDIIERLNKETNKSDYIRYLIRKDIADNNK